MPRSGNGRGKSLSIAQYVPLASRRQAPRERLRALAIAVFGLLLLAPLLHNIAAGAEAADPFVHPPKLERDVRFWIRVYPEVTTDQGLLPDDWNLGLVYEVLRFDSVASP